MTGLADAASSEARSVTSPGRRLLVVSYHFGASAIGGMRWHGFAKHLARAGWVVDVVTATPEEEVEACAGVFLHYRRPHSTLDDLYKALARRGRRAAGTSSEGSEGGDEDPGPGGAVRTPGVLHRVRRTAAQLLSFPDTARGWILPASLEARSLLRRHDYDLVVSSGPPHSAHVAASLAVARRSVPYWADMRDPWIGRRAVRDTRSELVKSLARGLEGWAFRTARLVLTNSYPYAAALRELYPDLVVETIPNGVDVEKLPSGPAPEPYPGVTLAHVGTIYLSRDVGTVLKAMRVAADRTGKEPPQLRLVGSVGDDHRERLARQVEESGLEDSVEMTGRLPRPEALEILRRSTFAVVLAQGQVLQVPGKLYESVAMGIPTIVVTEADSASAQVGRRIGALVVSDGEEDELGRLLAEAMGGGPAPTLAGPEELSYEARTRELRELVARALAS